ncbi:MAG TPA: nucleotidyltransferase family protein [Ilumatobacteraceae bacterium]
MPSATTLAALLAAGASSRFADGHKLLADLRGARLVDVTVATMLAAAIGPAVVVTGAVDLDLAADVEKVHNPRWAQGQATSMQCAIDAARRAGATAIVVGLADQPFVTVEAWRAVAASSAPIAVASYEGRRGNPVRLHESVWHLLPTTGDEGARALMRVRPDLVEPVPCAGSAADIDTLEDLQRWQSKS